MSIAEPREFEFEFGESDFSKLQSLVYEKTGIVLKDHKKNMLYSRLARRLRNLGLGNFKDYILHLESENGKDEVHNLINAVTTNLTKFFREDHHFKHLRDVSLKKSLEDIAEGKQSRLRVWSAGCSSGEEPYSIAMTMKSFIPNLSSMDARILATDLDTNMLNKGRSGLYEVEKIDSIPKKFSNAYTHSNRDGDFSINSDVKDLIAFKKLNLLHNWPMKGPFDVIFCRNVMIYFDAETKYNLMQKFATMLKPGGWLYIGHSETLPTDGSELKLIGRTMYRKEG